MQIMWEELGAFLDVQLLQRAYFVDLQ